VKECVYLRGKFDEEGATESDEQRRIGLLAMRQSG